MAKHKFKCKASKRLVNMTVNYYRTKEERHLFTVNKVDWQKKKSEFLLFTIEDYIMFLKQRRKVNYDTAKRLAWYTMSNGTLRFVAYEKIPGPQEEAGNDKS